LTALSASPGDGQPANGYPSVPSLPRRFRIVDLCPRLGSRTLRKHVQQQPAPDHDREDHTDVIEMPSGGAFYVFHFEFLLIEFAVNITGINSTEPRVA
jgi:hypothetical protein